MRRRSLMVLLLGALPAGAALGSSGQSIERSAYPVRLLSWPWYGKNGGFYLADIRGYFRQRQIGFVPLEAYGAPLPGLMAGKAEVAQLSTADALLAMERGAPIRIIAVRDALFPVVTVALPKSGIKTPKDYAGKRWGVSQENWVEQALLPVLAARAGVDVKSIRSVHVDVDVQLTTLMQGDVDFITAWWGSSLPQMLLAERKLGVNLSIVKWSQYGIDVYGDCLAVRTAWLNAHPELARGFLGAAVRGFEEMARDPAAVTGAITALYPDLAQFREVIRLQALQSTDLLYDSYSRGHGLFSIDKTKLARTRVLTVGASARIPLQETFSNAYLPSR